MSFIQWRVPPVGLSTQPQFSTISTAAADYQMWSSGTMVGGVLQNVPGVNYIGAGPVSPAVLQQMFSYRGPKALMGISSSIALLAEFGPG